MSGDITLIADSIDIDTQSANVRAQTRTITLKPLTFGQAIDLGATDSGTTLGLTDAELDRITAGTLRIGNTNSGAVSISQAIHPAGTSRLHLITSGSIIDRNAGGTDLTATELTLQAGTGIGTADSLEIDATTLVAMVTGMGAINLSDVAGGLNVASATTFDGPITLNSDPGGDLTLTSIQAGNGGAVTLTASGFIYAGNIATTGSASLTSLAAIEELDADATADITAGTLALSAFSGVGGTGQLEIDATTLFADVADVGSINLTDVSGGLAVTSATAANGSITINSDPGGDLALTSVTAGNGNPVIITASGHVQLGNVTTTGAVSIASSGAILDGNGPSSNVSAATLMVTAAAGIGSVSDPLETAVNNLEASGGSGGVFISNTGALTIGGVGSLVGVSATGGDVVLTASSPVTIQEHISAIGNIWVTAGETALVGDNLILNSGVTVLSTGGNVVLSAGDDINLPASAIVSASGNVTLQIGYSDSDGIGSGLISGVISSSSPVQVNGGAGSDTLTIDFASASLPAAGLNFDAGLGAADRFVAANTNALPVITTAFTGIGAASVSFGDVTSVHYSGLESVDMTGTIAPDIVFDLQGVADLATLEDDGVVANNFSRIRSRNGIPGFVTTTFVNPTTSLTTNMGSDGGDLLVAALDSSFNTSLYVNGQAGDDTIVVQARTGSGTFTFDGGAGVNRLVGPNVGYTWTINGSNAGFLGVAGNHDIEFLNIQNLVGGSLADKFKFTTLGAIVGSIDGGGGTDKLDLQVFTTPLAWNISGTNSGNVSTFAFISVEDLVSGRANDVFSLLVGGSAQVIDGGQGRDTLDYSAYTSAVTVNLQAGTAISTSSVVGIENVFGGSGNDSLTGKDGQNNILIGNAGNDTLTGGNGRDILVAGDGLDTLRGGSGEDILIAGRTSFDSPTSANSTALDAIMAEWSSARTYQQRLDNISGKTVGSTYASRLNGDSFLKAGTTVFNDSPSIEDQLFGEGDQDWFFAKTSGSGKDKVNNKELGEIVTGL